MTCITNAFNSKPRNTRSLHTEFLKELPQKTPFAPWGTSVMSSKGYTFTSLFVSLETNLLLCLSSVPMKSWSGIRHPIATSCLASGSFYPCPPCSLHIQTTLSVGTRENPQHQLEEASSCKKHAQHTEFCPNFKTTKHKACSKSQDASLVGDSLTTGHVGDV